MPTIRVMLSDTEVHRCAFDRDIISIGRSRDNDVVVENLAVSRNHARIRRMEDGRYVLSDLSSANGTFVNGVQATKIEIKHGDRISVGKHVLIFEDAKVSDAEMIGEAFGADRTIIVERVPNARLLIVKGKQQDQEIHLTKYETTIGRGADVDVRVSDWFASKRHAVILRQGTKFFLKDLGSWMGTYLNGQRIKEAQLSPGDEIKIGSGVFRFLVFQDEETMQIPPAVMSRKAGERLAIVAQPLMPPSKFVAGQPREETPDEYKTIALEGGPRAPVAAQAVAPAPAPAPAVPPAPPAVEEAAPPFPAMETAPQPSQSAEAVSAPPIAGQPAAEEQPVEAPSVTGDKEEITSKHLNYNAADSAVDSQASPHAHEIVMWERALTNRSQAVRREAAKMLKKLTGKDYDV